MKKQNIEVEGGELLIQSKEGHYAVIPAKHRQEVMDMIKDGCDDCVNAYIQTLPKDSDYAEDGSLYPEEPIINPNNPIQLKEVTITAEAPTYVKYKQEWEKENPFDLNKYIEDRFNNPVGREAIKRIDEKGWREQLKQEGLQKRQQELDEATKMGLLYQRFNPQDKDDISIADEQFQKRYGMSPHRYRYDNDPEYRKYYEQQARNATSKIDYPSTDLRRKDVVAPNNMWMYPNLTGESKKAMTDFSNEVIGMALPIPGLEAMGKIPSVFKAGKNLIKPVSNIANKTDDVVKKIKFADFNNDDDFFRIIVGDDAFDDIIKSNKVRTNYGNKPKNNTTGIDLENRGTLYPSFSKKTPSLEYAKSNPNHYIIKTSDKSLKPSTAGRHGKGSTMFPTDATGKHLSELDASKVEVYKHIGNGEYSLVFPITKSTVEAVAGNTIKSGKKLIKPVSKVLNKTDDVVKTATSSVDDVNISENQNFLTDLLKPKSKKTNSNFNFDKIPERKFTTLDDFRTNYKSEYNVENPSRTFYGEKLNIEGEESNFLTRSIDDKIEKHYNNEITFQKFKDYGGDESSYQKLIDNINTPSKTVSSGVDVGLLTDEGVSLAVHNKYLDPAQTRSTLFHEKAHQSKVVASKREDSLLPKLWDDINELTGYTKNYTDADKGSIGMYLSSPTEVYSRIMELRYKAYKAGLKPYEKFTKELLEKTGEVVRDSNGKITRMSGIMPPNYSKNMDKWLNLINKAPVIIPPVIAPLFGISYPQLQNQNKNKTKQK